MGKESIYSAVAPCSHYIIVTINIQQLKYIAAVGSESLALHRGITNSYNDIVVCYSSSVPWTLPRINPGISFIIIILIFFLSSRVGDPPDIQHVLSVKH